MCSEPKFTFSQVCWFDGVISGWYAWYQVILMVTTPCVVAGVGDSLCHFFFTYFEKQKIGKTFCGDDKTITYVNQHLKPYICAQLMTLIWKISPGMPKPTGLLNGALCAYLMRQNLHNGTHPRSMNNKCLCHIWKWSENIIVDLHCAKLKKRVKISPRIFCGDDKTPNSC